jgi:signal transduction histidine kinase
MLFSATLFTASDYGDPTRRELLLVDPVEGRDLLFELLSTPLQDPLGDSGVVSVLRNVNGLRRATEEIEEQYRKIRAAEVEVRAERDRLDLIINAVVDPVLVTDPSNNIVLMNPPAERLFAVDLAPKSQAAQRHVQANDAVFSSFVSNLFTNHALRWRSELNLVDPLTGEKLPFEAIAGKVISKRGDDTAVVTILHDRSEAIENARLYAEVKRYSEEQRQTVQDATEELRRQNELLRSQAIALEQASEAKSAFLANISHELRTPLNAVLGYTDLLRKGVFGSLQPRQLEKLERVDANSRHLLTIINDLLDIARIESGKMPVHITAFDVSDVLDEVLRELEPIITRSRPSVTCDVEAAIPSALTDRQKVKQVVLNLLSNALKFTPEGFVQVGATYDRASECIVVTVADTGVGIREDQQELIFEHFYQADDSSSRHHGGTGLGLAISRRLAAILGGRLSLVSKPGSGSSFSLHFPRQRGEE